VVTAADKNRYDAMFKTADKDMDGFVTGQETRETLEKITLFVFLIAKL
jgi:hypothetical protein